MKKKSKVSVQVNSKTSPKDNKATAYHGVANPKKFGGDDRDTSGEGGQKVKGLRKKK